MSGPVLPRSVLAEPRKRRGAATWHRAERCNRQTHAHTHHHGCQGRAPGDSRDTQDSDPLRSAAYMINYVTCSEGAELGCATRSPRASILSHDPQQASFALCRIHGPATPFPNTPSLRSSRTDTPEERQGHCATLWEKEKNNVVQTAASVPHKGESPDTSPPTPLPWPSSFSSS